VLAQARRDLPERQHCHAPTNSSAWRYPADVVSVDLADLHGYRYKTGATFAVHATD
jgi:hypothetical protein